MFVRMVSMLTKYKNHFFIVAIIGTAFIFGTLGSIFGAFYPVLVRDIEFIPDFLKPHIQIAQEISQNGSKVIRTVEESAVISAVDKASPAVVSIVTQLPSLDPDQGTQSQGIGTGFIVRSNGIILTASHVVDDSSITYSVVTKDGKTYEVKQIDRDPSIDFAILRIDAKGLGTLDLGDSDNIKVGQKVIAIGNALGRFDNTVTVGVVSGLGRGVDASSAFGISQGTLENVIQTDAALNPGNSGGPLLDLSAKVIGINFATTVGAENIGFVIPTNVIKSVLDQYYSEGRIIRPFLGISYTVVDKSTAVIQDIPEGIFVRRVVAGTPAEAAGLKAGDVITKFGGTLLTESNTLAAVIGKFRVGQKVELVVSRNGKTIKLKATLTEAP